MIRRRMACALLGSMAVAAAMTLPAAADATPSADAAPKVSASEMAAMQRDLHLTATQVNTRLAQEATAAQQEKTARDALGAAYAGSWFDAASGHLVVASTDKAKAAGLADVKTVTVRHSAAELNAVKSRIDALAGKAAPAGVTGWHVDSRTNSVVVTVNTKARTAAVDSFVAKATALGNGVVRTETVTESPRTKADIIGALPYYINYAARCSIGFTVYNGFVSAGHCGTPGSTATDSNGALLGTFQASTFPGNDWSYVAAAGGVNLYGYMYGYDGYYYYVSGSNEMPEGASVCRSGSTTGMHCGTIQAKNQTVNYPQGTVYGLTQTNVCAEPGDSGGSWLSANQAQGVTSGGSGNCTYGGTTFFQPVNPILATYGLTLVTTAP
ncbi:S1 family peptidase [Labedaea rhizosphaerae]|uniref:Alpha-lytic protease prodomain-containing protein n=1 Tax=Labedaea rhizosphaerae TaxID=598644 RepID=A0A4R6SG39_LABRH|nr:S1 family peptidase [Labedaea rhizosphaerae]TDQ00992.1 alpha-lytic protease prodomain-containing protein [Labedaea rhizosphaerae]